MRNYEGMFIITQTAANEDWEAAARHVSGILEKHGARIHFADKWGERRLAYPIRGHHRAVYYLTEFEAEPSSVCKMIADCRISEMILREMIVNRDHPKQRRVLAKQKENDKPGEDRTSVAGAEGKASSGKS